ncbi:MAG: hypothetical protein AAGA70_10520 [Pseudomonadota bacterium]
MKPLRIAALAVMAGFAMTMSALGQVAGEYFAYGRNADGSAYSGTVQIVQNGDGSFGVFWQVGSAYSGIGMLNGRVFEVNWGDSDPAVYVLMPDGELHGTWGDGTGLELLTRTPR